MPCSHASPAETWIQHLDLSPRWTTTYLSICESRECRERTCSKSCKPISPNFQFHFSFSISNIHHIPSCLHEFPHEFPYRYPSYPCRSLQIVMRKVWRHKSFCSTVPPTRFRSSTRCWADAAPAAAEAAAEASLLAAAWWLHQKGWKIVPVYGSWNMLKLHSINIYIFQNKS